MPIDRLISKITRIIRNLTVTQQIIHWSKTHSLPGLKRIPLYNLVRFLIDEANNDTLITRANSMAFSFFLAIFPGMIFMITLLPYLPYGDNFFITLQDSIKEIMPGESGSWVFETIQDLLKNQRANLLSFGFLLTLWFSSNGTLSMMNGLKKDNDKVFRKDNAWKQRLIAIQLTFMLAFTLFASVVLVILGNIILNFVFSYIKADFITKVTFFAFRWIVITLLFYTGISFIYRYGASTRKRTSFMNAGATLATLLSMAASWGFSFYADNFSTYNTVYGSIGTIIAFMLWIQINCTILLIGFELNAGIAVIRSEVE